MNRAHNKDDYIVKLSKVGVSKRETFSALIIALFLHILALLLLPRDIFFIYKSNNPEVAPVEEYEIKLVDINEQQFVEANPDVPKNKPYLSNNYSYREQQAADKNPQQDATDKPKVNGKENSQKILEGRLHSGQNVVSGLYTLEDEYNKQAGDTVEAEHASQKLTALIQNPTDVPEFIDLDLITENKVGSRSSANFDNNVIIKQFDPSAPLPVYRVDDLINEFKTSDDLRDSQNSSKIKPRLRPRLAAELITGPVMRSSSSANRYGSVAIDATFSKFGEYERQFYAAIQTGWYQEIEYFQPIDTATRVWVSFTIHSDGSITNLSTVQSTASDIATFICEEAISKRSPFRTWTKEMVEVFGIKKNLNIVFYYR